MTLIFNQHLVRISQNLSPPVDLYLISEKSIWKNQFQQIGLNLIFTACVAKMNFEIDFCRLKIQFIDIDFYNFIFQKSSADQQGVRFFDLFSKRIAIWYFQFQIRFYPHNWIFYFWYFRIHILTPLVFMFGLCCTRICPYCGYCAYWNFLKKGEFM